MRNRRKDDIGSDLWALMTSGGWKRGGQFEMVLCLALVLGRLAMSSTEIRNAGEGTDMWWG